MAIKISQVLKESEERKAAVPPLPRLKSTAVRDVVIIGPATAVRIDLDDITAVGGNHIVTSIRTAKEVILKDLYDQLAQVKRDRSVLASGNATMITRIHEQLKAKNKGTADEFISGRLPMPEIAEHYQRLVSHTQKASELWDKIRHVEKYGELPGVQEAPSESSDEGALKYKIRTLTDAISKTGSKLKKGKAYNPERLILWEEKVALLEAQRNEAQRELKQLQLNVRNDRQ